MKKTIYKECISRTLSKMSDIGLARRNFMIETIYLFLSIMGKINFLQLSRYGSKNEKTYRNQFEKRFDFLNFNYYLLEENKCSEYVIAFDPSYINKSGKRTAGMDVFWSGCAGKAKRGLEIGGIAAVDVVKNTAFHLEAVQTIPKPKQNLNDWYISVMTERISSLKKISKYLVVDAWFSNRKFITNMIEHEVNVVSRLRCNAHLKYYYTGSKTGKRGRPRVYGDKVNCKEIDEKYFDLVEETETYTLYSAVVYSISLKRKIRLAYYQSLNGKGKTDYKMYFSTDINLEPTKIYDYYKKRFQIEFIYRDAKQYTGLNDCQAQSENKLHFHFNMSMTSVNIAKIADWLDQESIQQSPFSLNNIKKLNFNELMLNVFLSKIGVNTNLQKIQKVIKKIRLYGTNAA
ncbi:transposase [Halosquirtibacter xylanolyticus]|uniref:transposase n=1 Tax=Halosquirtibacter xylanolyticus TaxID=3374599 RepID=UPI003749E428|nr:transposase [Prolixibacteraceae bacterium]QZT38475.1 transposase [Prolixibacteraceae bacterium]